MNDLLQEKAAARAELERMMKLLEHFNSDVVEANIDASSEPNNLDELTYALSEINDALQHLGMWGWLSD